MGQMGARGVLSLAVVGASSALGGSRRMGVHCGALPRDAISACLTLNHALRLEITYHTNLGKFSTLFLPIGIGDFSGCGATSLQFIIFVLTCADISLFTLHFFPDIFFSPSCGVFQFRLFFPRLNSLLLDEINFV